MRQFLKRVGYLETTMDLESALIARLSDHDVAHVDLEAGIDIFRALRSV